MAKRKGASASTLALMGWGLGLLLLGMGLGLLLSQSSCRRRERRPLPEEGPTRRPEAPPRPRPAPPRPQTVPPRTASTPAPDLPRLAVIIDDLGYAAPELVTRLVAQPVPLTVAVLPYQEHTRESAEIAFKAGKEVILHLPMEGRAEKDPGPEALKFDLPEAELRARTRKALADVPYIKGANNHMGSRLTADKERMAWVLGEFRGKKLFFVDSRTTKDTVALDVARGFGIPAAQRNVFLDDDRSFPEIEKQWDRAVELAKKEGSAIAIGHIYPETVAALERLIPSAKGRVALVRASELVR